MNEVNLKEISKRLSDHGWHSMAIRIHHPSFRVPKYRKDFKNSEEIYEYLMLHVSEEDAKYAVYG